MGRRCHGFARILMIVLLGSLVGVVHAEDDLEARLDALDELPGPEAIAELEVLLVAQTDPAQQRRVREMLGARFVREGNAYAALEHFEELVRQAPTDALRIAYAEALVLTARANLASGNTTAAGVLPYLTDARQAVDAVTADADPALRGRLVRVRAEAWYYAGEMPALLEALDPKVLDALPEAARAACWQLRAQGLYRTGDVAGAAEAFTKGGNARGAAASWSAAKDEARTVKAYAEMLTKTPHDLGLLAEAIAAVRYAGGVEDMQTALAAIPVEGPWKARYLVARADLLEEAGRTTDAVALLQEASALDTAFVDPLVRIARIHLGDVAADPGENRGRAIDVLLEALDRDPTDTDVTALLWHLAGQDYQEMWKSAATGPQFLRSVRVQRALLETLPDDALGWANVGNTLRVGGRTEEALAAYARAIKENPFDPAILSDRGLALSAAGRFEEALEAYLASVALDDSHLAGRQNGGRALWRAGRDDESEAQLAAAARKARHLGRKPMTYRFLLDRVWRTRQDEALR